jgi:hypothetical protein
VTKGLLQRIDLSAILLRADDGELTAAGRAVLADLGTTADAERASLPDVIRRWKHQFRERSPSSDGD